MSENNYIDFNEATLIAYINGELTDEKTAMVEHWMTLSDDNKEEVSRLTKIWEATAGVEPKPVAVDTQKALDKVMAQIKEDQQPISITPKTNYRRIFFSAAAVIVMLFGAVGLLNYLSETPIENIELTAQNSVLKDQLSDGTQVSLNENSILTYPKEFTGDQRRVKLNGEAFFDVERNEEKPFIIDLHHDFYVKVLGTSFNIKANEDDDFTEIYVSSGKVEVGSKDEKTILVAGETALINNETGVITRPVSSLNDVNKLYWINEEIEFDHTLLPNVLTTLEGVFKVKIDLECESKRTAQVVTHHQGDNIQQILDVIATMHDLKLIKIGNNYLLSCD